MFVRLVILAAAFIVLGVTSRAIADGAPVAAAATNVVLNRQLATLALSPPLAPSAHPWMPAGFSPSTRPVVHARSAWLANPTIVEIATRFTSAEHLMHFRKSGFDLNLWGIFDRSRRIRLGFAVRL
jgi:hypothetical protein